MSAAGEYISDMPEEETDALAEALGAAIGFGFFLNTMPEEETDALLNILNGTMVSTIAEVYDLFNGDLEGEDEVDAVAELFGEGLGYIAGFFCEL